MILQFSSGIIGPEECNLGIKLLIARLQKDYGEAIKILSVNKSKYSDGYRSALISSDVDLSEYNGTILWQCQSPIRKGWKRKNWFIDCSIIKEQDIPEIPSNIEKECIVSTMHSGGHGGQNINKVETGVRIKYKDHVVTCTSERSQLMNKRIAFKRLYALLEFENKNSKDSQTNNLWKEKNDIERGNPVKTFKGLNFKEIKEK